MTILLKVRIKIYKAEISTKMYLKLVQTSSGKSCPVSVSQPKLMLLWSKMLNISKIVTEIPSKTYVENYADQRKNALAFATKDLSL